MLLLPTRDGCYQSTHENQAAVMLAMGLEYIDSDGDTFKYIGILNFSVNGQGQLSRLTKDIVDLPDINMQHWTKTPTTLWIIF